MPPIRSLDLPRYANRAGDPAFPPPYVVDDSGLDIFICEGDPEALARMIDRALNIPTAAHYQRSDKLHFELASSQVGFACIDVNRLKSKPSPAQRYRSVSGLGISGVFARQTEVSVMVQVRDQDGLPFWYLPYVFNGLPAAVTSGREIYGYPKQYAAFAADDEPAGAGAGKEPLFGPRRRWEHRAVVHAYDLVLHEDEAEFALTPVFEFHRGALETIGSEAESKPALVAPDPEDFEIYPGPSTAGLRASARVGEQFQTKRTAAARRAAPEDTPDPSATILRRIRSDVPYVFLRQFREPERESLASYQAMVIGRLVPDAADALRAEASHDFSLVLHWAFNLALAEEVFGRQTDVGTCIVQPVVGLLTGAHATFDVLRASVLWQFGSDREADAESARNFASWRQECLRAPSVDADG